MRHRKRHSKLSMKTSHRKAMLRSMVKSLLKYQSIQTIHARAKEARRLAEHLITLTKRDCVASRRAAFSVLTDRDLVTKLFKEIAPLFKSRNSGFTRIIPLGFRRGDGADMVILEFTEKNVVEKITKKKVKKADAAKPEEKPGAAKAEKDKVPEEVETKKEDSKLKAMSKAKPTLADEKKTEKAKSEVRKIAGTRNFMKNLRGLFRKRGDR